jgi:hypothetical protein
MDVELMPHYSESQTSVTASGLEGLICGIVAICIVGPSLYMSSWSTELALEQLNSATINQGPGENRDRRISTLEI